MAVKRPSELRDKLSALLTYQVNGVADSGSGRKPGQNQESTLDRYHDSIASSEFAEGLQKGMDSREWQLWSCTARGYWANATPVVFS